VAAVLHPIAENPLPPGAEAVELVTRDKVRLRAMRAVPENPRGTFVILGGRGDFMERYFETVHELMARGFAVVALDMRGQGGSQRPKRQPYRDRTRSFARFDEDVRTLMEDLVIPSCPQPYYALGHSTGAHVLLRQLRGKAWFARAILVSPLVEILYGPWPRPVAWRLLNTMWATGLSSRFLPGVHRRPMGRDDFPGNPLTSDRRRWERDSATLEVAPHLGLGGPTYGWLGAARVSIARLRRMRRKPLAPVLIVAAGADRVVGNEGIRRLARRLPGVALTFIPDANHEILGERDMIRRQFLAALDSFLPA
jgi:lysophospholipase